jgi:hypothetical protein
MVFQDVSRERKGKRSNAREAYVLSKLQSLSAWRGQLVDMLISQHIVPALNRHQAINQNMLLKQAKSLFDLQLDFALRHRVREPNMSLSKAGDTFAAFHPIEYDEDIRAEQIAEAWNDIRRALTNLFQMEDLWTFMRMGVYRIAQRPLQFVQSGVTVKALPDRTLPVSVRDI